MKPKPIKKNVKLNLSEETLTLIKSYSKYTKYSQGEVVDNIIKNVLNDEDFIAWVSKQRDTKKINSVLKDNGIIIEDKRGEQNG
jgi:hypothetical protein